MEKLIQYTTGASLFSGEFRWQSAGMGYLITTSSGKIIAVDGGHPEDAEGFASLLEANSAGKPEVDLWILTHPHKDHYGALYGIASDVGLSARISVKRIACLFPREFKKDEGVIDYVFPHLDVILSSTGAEHIEPTEEMTVAVDSMTVKFLFSPTDISWIPGPNELSLIFTVKGEGKKVLFNGDAGPENLEYVLKHHADELKSDIIQIPHHGLAGTGLAAYYETVDAGYAVLVPISESGDKSMAEKYTDNPGYKARISAENNAEHVYKAFEGTQVIEL